MVYVVERYLPGLAWTDMVRSLARLEQAARELRAEGTPINYLGSTIVARDETCTCHFEGSEAAVIEANRRAGVPFDRILEAVAVTPAKGGSHDPHE
ncbi:MAG TPA: nickel-binding protein [Thermoleophilaceae bacterium]|jgi:hypothetical protein